MPAKSSLSEEQWDTIRRLRFRGMTSEQIGKKFNYSASGIRKYTSIPIPEREVISPNGKSFTVTNRTNFCRRFRLNYTNFGKLLRGKIKKYRGWTLVK